MHQNWGQREFHCGTAEMNPTRNHEVVGLIPGLAQWVGDLVWWQAWLGSHVAVAPAYLGTSICYGCGPKKTKKKKKPIFFFLKLLRQRS